MKLNGKTFKLKKEIYGVVFGLWVLLFFVFSFENNDEADYESTLETDSAFETSILGDDFENLDIVYDDKSKYDLILEDYKNQIKKKEIEYTSKSNINFYYSPIQWEKYLLESQAVSNISDILFSKVFREKNLILNLEFYLSESKIRGRYKHNAIKFFDVKKLSNEELISVFIHELGHYFDIKHLEKEVIFDVSNDFYDISWNDTKSLHPGSEKKDFVSWYAMTNKYEDFAESFTYYILYNDDFRTKASLSKVLLKKYDFFSKYVFRNDEFKKTNFRIESKLLDYYWDTTKIKFSIKNFLEYLKNWV